MYKMDTFSSMWDMNKLENVAVSCIYRNITKALNRQVLDEIPVNVTNDDDISFCIYVISTDPGKVIISVELKDKEYKSNPIDVILGNVGENKKEIRHSIMDLMTDCIKPHLSQRQYLKLCESIIYYYLYNYIVLPKMLQQDIYDGCFVDFGNGGYDYIRIWIRLQNREIKCNKLKYTIKNTYSVSLLFNVDNEETKRYVQEIISGDGLDYDKTDNGDVSYDVYDDKRFVICKCLRRVLCID